MIWVILHVEENGLLGVTQQFSNISSSYTSSNQNHQSSVTSQNVVVENPFSPRKLTTTSLHATTTTAAGAALERPANFQPSAMGDNPFLTGSNNQPFPAGPVQHNFGASDGANGKCDMFCEPLSLSSAAAAAAGNTTITTTTTTTRGGHHDSINRTLMNANDDNDVVITHYNDSNSCSSASPRRPHNADYLLNVLNIPMTADVHSAHAHAAHTAHGGGLPSSWPGTPTFSMVRTRNVHVCVY